ncbi:Mechanosensitive ion channel [Acinetobacter marinus]|uniref:Small-conductance mechanosensitive channel n=1 Tax=Acinetobacter marinus TaxID=281375 RepID=A0A1G6N0Y9_9GAMM|nr:Mechanosensitive ion channel [Acinetobacter marinus]
MSNESTASETAKQAGNVLLEAGQKTTAKVIEESQKYSDAYVMMNKFVSAFWERVPYIIIGLVVFLIFMLLVRVFKYFVKKALMKRSHTRQNLVLVLNRVGSVVIMSLGFLIALVIIIPGFSPGQLVSALGIGSVAIGFAFKDIFQNLLSGILILIGEPFRIGDDIIVEGLEGTVEDIQIRATFLRSYDGRRLVIPNATVYTSPITVNTAYNRRRCEFVVGIGYDDDIDKAKTIINRILDNNANVLGNPAHTVTVTALADFSVNLTVRWWIDLKETNILASASEIQAEVKQAFNQEGVNIPYPIQEMKMSAPQAIAAPTSSAE